jgi:hypothetical protein
VAGPALLIPVAGAALLIPVVGAALLIPVVGAALLIPVVGPALLIPVAGAPPLVPLIGVAEPRRALRGLAATSSGGADWAAGSSGGPGQTNVFTGPSWWPADALSRLPSPPVRPGGLADPSCRLVGPLSGAGDPLPFTVPARGIADPFTRGVCPPAWPVGAPLCGSTGVPGWPVPSGSAG